MKKTLLVLLLGLCVTSNSFAQGIFVEDKPTVIVTEFGDHPKATEEEINLIHAGKAASEYILHKLVQTDKFNVLDCSVAQKEFEEKGVRLRGIIPPSTAKELGKQVGARYLVYGNLTNVGVSSNESSAGSILTAAVGVGPSSITIGTTNVRIVVRIMDTHTGKIIMAAKGEGKSKTPYVDVSTKNNITVSIGTSIVTQDSVTSAIQKAANNAVDVLLERLYGKQN